jgi:pyruvate carboxylase subunit B
MKKKIDFMLTAFRDGFQSVYGARVFSKDYLPVVEEAVQAGIQHLEAGGGAMYQSPYFYTKENAFEVMDAFRKVTGPKANLQTLSRGVNVVALDSQPSDVIKLHAQMFKKHGMTTIRNFDALNDVNNLIYSGQCIKEAGLKHEVTITMMELPPNCEGAHTPEFYINTLKKILDAQIPFDSVCFKDASGTSRPQKVYDTIAQARKLLGPNVRIVFHSHETAGSGTVAYKAAIEAGVTQLDLSLAPVSGGTCQPDLITMWHVLRGTDYDLDIDIFKIMKLEESFKAAMRDYFLPPEATKVEPMIPFFPLPGGALTANTQMLRDNNLMDKYPLIIAAMGETVAKGGFGTSVTPVSQFYFQQAFNNVMFGTWKKIAPGYGKMVLGYFGKTPVAPDPEVVKIAEEQLGLTPTTETPIAINDRNPEKGLTACRKVLEKEGLPVTDENLFIIASCAEKGVAFLKGTSTIGVRKETRKPEAKVKEGQKANACTVKLNGKSYHVKLENSKATVDGEIYSYEIGEGGEAQQAAPAAAAVSGEAQPLTSALPGLVLRIEKKVGDFVQANEAIMIIESMKMETPLNSPVAGRIAAINVTAGEQIQAGAVVATVQKTN